MPALVLIALSLSFMVFRVASPHREPSEGRVLRTVRLGYMERLAMQRINLCCLAVILLLGAVSGWIRLPFEILAMLAAYGVLMVPVRYEITTQGIGMNNLIFRRWSEFASMEAAARKLTLVGRPGNGRFPIWTNASQQAELLPLLRRYVQDSTRSEIAPTAEKGGLLQRRFAIWRELARRV